MQLPRHYLLIMLAAALLNISPFLFRHVGADIWFYLVWMRCFSEQLWQGDIYPRWCMDANAGLGTSLFLFYFPLPFYIAALFQPLVWLGLSYYGLFVALCFASSVFAVAACYSWLKETVEPRYALLASVLYIFMPYHLETMFFRGSVSEIWCFGLLPLLFKYACAFTQNRAGSFLALVLLIGLLVLTHIPVAAEALLFTGFYIAVMTGRAWKPKLRFACAVLWGMALGLYYLVPGIYYHQYLANAVLAKGLFGWPNNYLSSDFWRLGGLERPLLSAALTLLIACGFAIHVYARRARVADMHVRNEMLVWLVVALLSLYMLFPASAPLYALMGPLAKVVFPWRMQMVTTLGVTFLLAVWAQWMIAPGRRKTWKMDLGISIAALWAVSHIMVASYGPDAEALNEKIRAGKIVFASEYRSQWTDGDHWKYPYLLEREENDIPEAALVSGKGSVTVGAWGWRGMDMQVQTEKPATLRLNHSYFPVWRATGQAGGALPLRPEDKTGLMLVDVPGGTTRVSVRYSITNGNPAIAASQWVSLLAWLALVAAWRAPKLPMGRNRSCR